MARSLTLPNAQASLVGSNGKATTEFRKFLDSLASQAQTESDAAAIAELQAAVAALEANGGSLADLLGENGIQVVGKLTDPLVRIRLTAKLSQLVDVSTAIPAHDDALRWDAATNLWTPTAVASSQLFQRVDTGGDFRVTTDGNLRVTD